MGSVIVWSRSMDYAAFMSDIMDALKLAIKNSLGAWFESHSRIKLKSGAIVTPSCNELQDKVSEVLRWCKREHRPARIIILKPRQKGCSTISVAALYHHFLGATPDQPFNGAIIGGAHEQSENLMGILRTYAENDDFDGGGHCVISDAKPITGKWRNGSRCKQMTARNPESGRSGTYQAIIATEVARWAEEGVADAKKVLSGLLKCVGFEDGTMIVLESTASGASGDFYDRWQKAIPFEEAQEGKAGYIKVFMPWFVFDDSRRKGKDKEAEGIHSEDDYTDEEMQLAKEFDLDEEQVAWMRWALREECDDDMEVFRQDYPFDEDTAFLKSGRGRFNLSGLRHQREVANGLKPDEGVLERNRDGLSGWRPVEPQESMWHRWEQPIEGRRYLIAVDNMTGESQVGGDDPDSHGIKVLRAGYMCANRGWIEPAIVMEAKGHKDRKRFGVWWDTDVLADEVSKLSRYWGDCTVVPEMNRDAGLVELLKIEGVPIYQRQMFNRRDNVRTKALGWMTDTRTRPKIIENLARCIRESGRGQMGEGLQINSVWTVNECQNFIIKNNGRAEAAQGHHDDQVLSLANGLYVLDSEAVTYYEPRVESWLPPEIRRANERNGIGARDKGSSRQWM